ncbi:ABC transporter permease [Streptomyces tendae]|uniref:ABC transporter permease n=1 Tax=Streptomyces tendae TaxID=1932 RepID=UPI00371D6688
MSALTLDEPPVPTAAPSRRPDRTGLLLGVAKRLATAVFVLLCTATVAFFLVRLSGDPVKILLPPDATAEQEQVLRHSLGLDQSLFAQYLDYLRGLLHLDFGDSLVYGQPVSEILADRLPATLELAAAALAVTLVIAIPAGIVAAVRRGRGTDNTVMTGVLLGQSTPPFWVGILLILDVLSSDHIRSARAKGFGPLQVVLRHGLRNASLPVVTVVGLEVGNLLGGAILTERVFSWPGVGQLTVEAISNRDFPLVQATVLFFAATFVVVNLLVDLSYSFLDPRVRTSR